MSSRERNEREVGDAAAAEEEEFKSAAVAFGAGTGEVEVEVVDGAGGWNEVGGAVGAGVYKVVSGSLSCSIGTGGTCGAAAVDAVGV